MTGFATALIILIISAAIACQGDVAPPTPAVPPATPSAAMLGDTDAAIVAANSFLAALDAEQYAAAVYPFDSELRPNWSNLPAGPLRFDRNGVRIGDIDAEQTALLHNFLRAALSQHGYDTVVGIVGADGALARSAGGRNPGWSEDNYWLAFFGEPFDTNPRGWQFGGHHLAVNVTIVNGRSYLSPTLIATEPASYSADGRVVAPLTPHLDAGIALINGLGSETRTDAQARKRPDELHAGAGEDGTIPKTEGSPVSGWTADQRQLLMDAVAQWVNLLPESSAQARLSEIAANLEATHFAWHGSADGAGALYYRIQNPTLIVEFATQGDLGDDGGHYHSIYRDPTNEYGGGRVR